MRRMSRRRPASSCTNAVTATTMLFGRRGVRVVVVVGAGHASCLPLGRLGGVPDAVEALRVGLEQVAAGEAAQVQERGVGAGEAVDVGVDEHLVVEAVDRVVERGAVAADLDAGGAVERLVERERVADLGPERGLADAFVVAAARDFSAGGVAEQQADLGAGLGLRRAAS